MKKLIIIKKSTYLSVALLALASFSGVQIYANPTPATLVGALAADKQKSADFVAKFFDGTKNGDVFVDSLVEHLAKLDAAFGELKANTDARVLVETIFAQIENLPQELQNRFEELGQEQCINIVNETKAFDILNDMSSKKPKRAIPKWDNFIDNMTFLLHNSPEFKEFTEFLQTIKTKNLAIWKPQKIQIGSALKGYFEKNGDKFKAIVPENIANQLAQINSLKSLSRFVNL